MDAPDFFDIFRQNPEKQKFSPGGLVNRHRNFKENFRKLTNKMVALPAVMWYPYCITLYAEV